MKLFKTWKALYMIWKAKRVMIQTGATPLFIITTPKIWDMLNGSWLTKKTWDLYLSDEETYIHFLGLKIIADEECRTNAIYILEDATK